MTASISVVELTSITPAAIRTVITPSPTPVTPVAIGMIAANAEPRVTTRMTIATTRPRPSMIVNEGMWTLNTSPPTFTWEPGRVCSRALAVAVSSSRWASVNVETVPSTRTRARPLVPSSVIWPSRYSRYIDSMPLTNDRSASRSR